MGIFNKNVMCLDTVDSTNKYAIQLLTRQHIPEGTMILAWNQIAGMGLGTNKWAAEPGKSLTFSIVFHPAFLPPEKQFSLNQVISLGIRDFFSTLIEDAGLAIKWPNDIYFGKNKLGGILIQNIITGLVFETSVAGVGLNINQERFPSDIPNPISLKQILGKETDINYVSDGVYDAIEARYVQLVNGSFRKLQKDYTGHLLGWDHWRNYLAAGKHFEGMIKGVSDFGRLIVETSDGRLLEFDHKEIEYIF
jgi:BirA family transcriptional regulator, biotin operon repressor / biotin---[acetyl-CoA-carboxylase] ligase